MYLLVPVFFLNLLFCVAQSQESVIINNEPFYDLFWHNQVPEFDQVPKYIPPDQSVLRFKARYNFDRVDITSGFLNDGSGVKYFINVNGSQENHWTRVLFNLSDKSGLIEMDLAEYGAGADLELKFCKIAANTPGSFSLSVPEYNFENKNNFLLNSDGTLVVKVKWDNNGAACSYLDFVNYSLYKKVNGNWENVHANTFLKLFPESNEPFWYSEQFKTQNIIRNSKVFWLIVMGIINW